jgi:pimeloyl-ACP methyl ester carboxylesterase
VATFVLIHGAWQAAWCWSEVAPLLEKQDQLVVTFDLPGHGRDRTDRDQITMQHYVDALAAAIEPLSEPPIVVAHSMGGPLTAWAEAHPNKARSLVFVGANIPPNGLPMLAVVEHYDPAFPASFVWAQNGRTASITREGARRFLYPQCPERILEEVLPRLTPEPVAPFETPITSTEDRFGRIPRYYVETLQDGAVPLPLQRSIQATVGFRRVFSLDTDHSPFFSAPDELVACLRSVAVNR